MRIAEKRSRNRGRTATNQRDASACGEGKRPTDEIQRARNNRVERGRRRTTKEAQMPRLARQRRNNNANTSACNDCHACSHEAKCLPESHKSEAPATQMPQYTKPHTNTKPSANSRNDTTRLPTGCNPTNQQSQSIANGAMHPRCRNDCRGKSIKHISNAFCGATAWLKT